MEKEVACESNLFCFGCEKMIIFALGYAQMRWLEGRSEYHRFPLKSSKIVTIL